MSIGRLLDIAIPCDTFPFGVLTTTFGQLPAVIIPIVDNDNPFDRVEPSSIGKCSDEHVRLLYPLACMCYFDGGEPSDIPVLRIGETPPPETVEMADSRGSGHVEGVC
jgi:hypothetical protein